MQVRVPLVEPPFFPALLIVPGSLVSLAGWQQIGATMMEQHVTSRCLCSSGGFMKTAGEHSLGRAAGKWQSWGATSCNVEGTCSLAGEWLSQRIPASSTWVSVVVQSRKMQGGNPLLIAAAACLGSPVSCSEASSKGGQQFLPFI